MIDEEIYNKYNLDHYIKVKGKDGNFHIKKVDVAEVERIKYLTRLLKEWLPEDEF